MAERKLNIFLKAANIDSGNIKIVDQNNELVWSPKDKIKNAITYIKESILLKDTVTAIRFVMEGKVFVGNLDIRYNNTSILYQENGKFVDRNGQPVLPLDTYKKSTVSNTTVYLPKPEYKHTILEEHIKKYNDISFYTFSASSYESIKEQLEKLFSALISKGGIRIVYINIPIKYIDKEGKVFEMNILNVYHIDGDNGKYWLFDEFSKPIYAVGEKDGGKKPSISGYSIKTEKGDIIYATSQSGDIINYASEKMFVYKFDNIHYNADGKVEGLTPKDLIEIYKINLTEDEIAAIFKEYDGKTKK